MLVLLGLVALVVWVLDQLTKHLVVTNLDLNELEGSIRSLSLALAEYGAELLTYLGK